MLTAFGYLMAISSSLPEAAQAVRTYRLKHTYGLSTITQTSYLMSWSVWAVYGVVLGEGPVVASALFGAAVVAANIHAIGRAGTLPGLRRLVAPAAAYTIALAVVITSPRAGGAALAVVDLTMFLPQLTAAVRQDDLTGISPLAAFWELGTSAGWVAYTVLRSIPEAGIYSSVYTLMMAVVCYRIITTRVATARAANARVVAARRRSTT